MRIVSHPMRLLALLLVALAAAVAADGDADGHTSPSFVETSDMAAARKLKVIFGNDDRRDWYELNAQEQRIMTGAAVLVSNMHLRYDAQSDTYTHTDYSRFEWAGVADGIPMCADEKFRNQIRIGWSSAFLIGSDVLVTAGHSLKSLEELQRDAGVNYDTCSISSVVFDWDQTAPTPGGDPSITFPAANVFSCKELLAHGHDRTSPFGVDHSVFRVARAVPADRYRFKISLTQPLPGEKLILGGYFYGLPSKFDDGLKVQATGSSQSSFLVTSDSWGGNSGSFVIKADTYEVVGLLSSVQDGFVYDPASNCARSRLCSEETGCGQGGFHVVTRASNFAESLVPIGINVIGLNGVGVGDPRLDQNAVSPVGNGGGGGGGVQPLPVPQLQSVFTTGFNGCAFEPMVGLVDCPITGSGVLITLKGDNFGTSNIGSNVCVAAPELVDADTLVCELKAGEPGTLLFVYVVNADGAQSNQISIMFASPTQLLQVTASEGCVAGANGSGLALCPSTDAAASRVTLTFVGRGFGSSGATVNDACVPGTLAHSPSAPTTTLSCMLKAGDADASVLVRVTNTAGVMSTALPIAYMAAPTLETLTSAMSWCVAADDGNGGIAWCPSGDFGVTLTFTGVNFGVSDVGTEGIRITGGACLGDTDGSGAGSVVTRLSLTEVTCVLNTQRAGESTMAAVEYNGVRSNAMPVSWVDAPVITDVAVSGGCDVDVVAGVFTLSNCPADAAADDSKVTLTITGEGFYVVSSNLCVADTRR
jgi:hypothetical protein